MTAPAPKPHPPVKAIEAPAPRVFHLTAADRCDVRDCGARAWHRLEYKATGHQLHFCHHHGKEVKERIRPEDAHWLDESDAINPPREFYN